jgi:hypothetical protein
MEVKVGDAEDERRFVLAVSAEGRDERLGCLVGDFPVGEDVFADIREKGGGSRVEAGGWGGGMEGAGEVGLAGEGDFATCQKV